MALLAAADVYPSIPGLASGADAALDALIGRVESQLAGWCGWRAETAGGSVSWDSASRTSYLDGPAGLDRRALQLPVRPVASITSIYDDPTWGYSAAGYLVASGDYTLLDREGRVLLNPDASHSWSVGKRHIEVICVAGYSTAPNRLHEAVVRQVAYAWSVQKSGGRKTASAGNARSSLGELPPIRKDVKQLLGDFRQPEFWLGG